MRAAKDRSGTIGRNVPQNKSISNIANANRARRVVFTREALAHARHQYEHTPLSLARIAVDLGIHKKTFRNLARSQAWVRYVRPPRGLLPAVQLNARASELEAQAFDASIPATPFSENADAVRRGEGTGPNSASPVLPQLADTVDRLYRAVMDELVAVETLRAQVKREPKSPQDAERTARTLSSLTETLQKLQRLQCAAPQSGPHDDDIPADIDEFRTALARRIEAFEAGLTRQLVADPSLHRWILRLDRDFITLAHRHQEPPPHANGGSPWTTWLMLGGRGAGKTRLGAEWVRAVAHGTRPYASERSLQIALVGETEHDVREVMIEGPAGLLQISPRSERPQWRATRRRLEWPNGAVAFTFSAEDPEQLRGPQFDAAWCDELAKWHYVDATFDMLQFGLRLGPRPRQLITTTPRPIPLIKRLIADPRTAVTRAATHANAAHLSPAFLAEVLARYAGTRLGRQEIDGEIIEDRADALWTRAIIEASRVSSAPALLRIVIGVDPPGSARPGADACGIVAAGIAENERVYVLEDASVQGLAPGGWAMKAVALFKRLNADALVAEVNQGGDMVRAVLEQVDRSIPLRTVRATRGKWLRAEPIAMLYQQGRVKHVDPPLVALEDEMCDFGMAGLSSGGSPDRLDALVWAVTELTARAARREPRVRGL
jgi:phage terminase large subunit-like protein